MLEFLKNYYVFMLILMVLSYLVPREEYKVYIQFFVSIFIIVLLLKPVLEILSLEKSSEIYEVFNGLNEQISNLDFEIEEREDMFEHFFVKGKGE